MDLGFRGIYDLHHQCIPKKKLKEREREREGQTLLRVESSEIEKCGSCLMMHLRVS